jgi:L-ascorbate metabolism protein UlaG (beta-lactamase superfamily)
MTLSIERRLLAVLLLLISVQFMSARAGLAKDIQVHYLGHAGFIFQFSNGIGVVTDYAYFHDIGTFKPDVATYSHGHDDHAGGILPSGMNRAHVLANSMALALEGVTFIPIITSETTPGSNNNSSYLITYQEFSILHLGDAQADISVIESEKERAHLKQILPERIDLLLIPIGNGQCSITNEEVAQFIDFVQPRMVVPMHYWNFIEKWLFMRHMQGRNETNGGKYRLLKIDSPKYAIDFSRPQEEGVIDVIALDDGDYE